MSTLTAVVACAGARSLRHTYEGDPDFAALPTFAVMAALGATDAVPLGSFLPRYNHVSFLEPFLLPAVVHINMRCQA